MKRKQGQSRHPSQVSTHQNIQTLSEVHMLYVQAQRMADILYTTQSVPHLKSDVKPERQRASGGSSLFVLTSLTDCRMVG